LLVAGFPCRSHGIGTRVVDDVGLVVTMGQICFEVFGFRISLFFLHSFIFVSYWYNTPRWRLVTRILSTPSPKPHYCTQNRSNP